MGKSTPLFVGLDVHKDSTAVAHRKGGARIPRCFSARSGRARRISTSCCVGYAAQLQGVPHPRVASEVVCDYLAHLAVRQQVSARTRNQVFCAILFLCREVLGVDMENLSPGLRAKRGERLPVILSMPETTALLDAMSVTPRLMATLIYGGGLRGSECWEIRIKDLDLD